MIIYVRSWLFAAMTVTSLRVCFNRLSAAVGGTADHADKRPTSVHAATTPKHNSSSYKARETRPGRAGPGQAMTVREDRLRRGPDRGRWWRSETPGPTRVDEGGDIWDPVPHQTSSHVADRRPAGARPAFHQSLTLNI